MYIYNYDMSGNYISKSEAVESPLEKGVYLIPANATEIEPLADKIGYNTVFNGSNWEYIKKEIPTKPNEYSIFNKSTWKWEEDEALKKEIEETNLASFVRAKRDSLMQDAQNRVDRYNREVAMNISLTDDIIVLYTYMQDLANIPEQEGFPTDVTWPTIP